MEIDGAMVPIVLFVMGGLTVIFTPLVRAYARRLERGESSGGRTGSGVSPDMAARLERMEHALDSIAIEVERISEGQRFTTRLLADRAGSTPPPSGMVEKKP